MIEDRIREIAEDTETLRDLAYGTADIKGDIPKIGKGGSPKRKVINREAYEALERLDQQLRAMHKRRVGLMDRLLEKKRPVTSQESS